MTSSEATLKWKIDECSPYFERMRIRGWCFHPAEAIAKVEIVFPSSSNSTQVLNYGLPSPDVASCIHAAALNARFDKWIVLPEQYRGQDFHLRFTFNSGVIYETGSALENARQGDPSHGCWDRFIDQLETIESTEVLEMGSRARSGITVKELIPKKHAYVGLDILPGPNVDVVGDAHCLSTLFSKNRFGAIFSRSVFEHLAMPWKVVIEANHVLATGGFIFASTHQTWVLHEQPWDFWRYSTDAWATLFNRFTGFEIIETAYGEPARIHAMWNSPIVYDMASHPAFLSSAVIARKISGTDLTWPVPLSAIQEGTYPPGELPRHTMTR